MDIKEAIAELDPKNDAHWTEDGLPLVDEVQKIAGDFDITREQITEASPDVTRASALADVEPDEDEDGTEEQAESETPLDPLAEAKERLAEVTKVCGELRSARERIDAELKAAQAEHDRLQTYIDRTTPRDSNQENINQYLAKQHEIREARAGRAKQLRETGLTIKDLAGGAPIDQAMARKTQRGAQRPTR